MMEACLVATKRTKGSAFERFISTRLSKWWSHGKHDDLAWRTAGSGGRATRRVDRRTQNHYGDIGPTDDSMKPFFSLFAVELKFGYSKFSPYDMLDSIRGFGQLGKWWDKLLKTTKKAKAEWPMMVWRRNGKQEVVIIPIVAAKELRPDRELIDHDCCLIRMDTYRLFLTPLDRFLDLVTPGNVRTVHARLTRSS